MFIVWNGLGFLVIPVVIVSVVLGGAIAQFEPNVRWPQMISVLGTALGLFGLGLIRNRSSVVGHDRFGNTVAAKDDHSLYWIPVQYWSAIALVVGTIIVFKT